MNLATFIGLCIALGGPALLAGSARKILGGSGNLTTSLLAQLVLWVLLGLILAVVILWEKQPLSSIGWRHLSWESLAWGLVLAGALIFLVSPVLIWLLKKTGLSGFEGGLAKLANLPVWFLVIAAVTAGVVEEALYRGYAIERLALFTGSYWWAGLISLVVFALAHLSSWGFGPMLTFMLSGGLLTIFYIWKQDLLACMIAHAVTDAIGLIIMPPLSRVS